MLGPAAVLAYLLCAVLVGLVGLCLAEVGSRVSHPGGLYAYATEAFGPVVGGVAGTLLWVANSVVSSAAVANLLVDTIALAIPAIGVGMWRLVTLVTLYAFLAAVNIRGARSGARLSMILAVVKITPLVLLVVVGAFAVRMSNLQWVAVPAASQVGQTAVLLFFAFIGVEGALNVSGEVANPSRTVPRAIFLALALVTALYIGLQMVAQGVLGAGLPGAPAPLVAAATTVFGPWGTRLLFATTILSVVGFLSADVLCSPRNLAALAERRQLPQALASVHPRFKTPAIAIGVYAVMCATVALSGSFRQLVIASTSGTLVLYLICCLGLLRLRARDVATSGPPFRAPGGSLVPLAASAIILWLLSTLAWTELAAAMGLVVASGGVYALRERWVRKRVGLNSSSGLRRRFGAWSSSRKMGLKSLFHRVLKPTRTPVTTGSSGPGQREREMAAAWLEALDRGDLNRPEDIHDVSGWNTYWTNHLKFDVWGQGFSDMMLSDDRLIGLLSERGVRTVLCAGSGLSGEPLALALHGFKVTSLDISTVAVDTVAGILRHPEHEVQRIPGLLIIDQTFEFGDSGPIAPELCPSIHRSATHSPVAGGIIDAGRW